MTGPDAVTLLGLALGAGLLTWGVGFITSAVSDAITQIIRRARLRRRQPPLGQLVRHPALDDYLRWRDGAPVTEVIVAQPALRIEGDPDPALGCRPCTYPYCVAGWETEAYPW